MEEPTKICEFCTRNKSCGKFPETNDYCSTFTEKTNDPIHPYHYNQYDMQVIEMMERIWGKEETRIFCKLNAFKYRMRLGLKDDFKQDLEKEKFYLDYAKKLSL